MILGLACLLSENRRAISKRVVFWGLTLQWGFALLVLKFPAGQYALQVLGSGVEAILACALEGATFVFGKGLADAKGPAGFVFAFRVLPTVIFAAASFAILYQLGIMQLIVRAFAIVMARLSARAAQSRSMSPHRCFSAKPRLRSRFDHTSKR